MAQKIPPPPPLSSYRPSHERGAPIPQRGPLPPPPAGYQPRRQPPKRSGGGLLLGIVYFFMLVLFVVGGGVAYLFINPPSELIRTQIAQQVKARTGRDLIISGPASFTVFPAIGVSLNGVSLSGPPGDTSKLVDMHALDVRVKLAPLFSRRIAIDSLVLKKPVFSLRVDKSGRKNWDFASDNPAAVRYADARGSTIVSDAAPIVVAAADAAKPNAGGGDALDDVQFDDVRIVDGTFRFADERKGRADEVSGINVKFGLKSLAAPITATGNLAWRGEQIDFDGTLTSLDKVRAQQPAKLAFTAKNRLLSATYDGGVLIKDDAYLEGKVTANASSARALAGWFGTTLPPVQGFGPLSISGTLKTVSNVTTFSGAQFGLDGSTANGNVTITTGGVRPNVQANLVVSDLDLNKYMTDAVTGVIATDTGGAPAPAAADPQQGGGQGQEKSQDQIENLLKGSKVYGAMQREGWSSEQMNFALLGLADGSSNLKVGKLRFRNINIDQSDIALAVKNRVMKATLNDARLYQGQGRGSFSVDGSGKAANIAANIALDGVSAQHLLKDAANFDMIAGKANVGLQIASTGASQLQLVENLNGKAQFKFNDGSIVGFNVPGALRGVSKGDFSGLKKAPSEKTDFSELGATFTVTNGVAENNDLSLVSPMLRVTGAGQVHMPQRTIDYMVKPKLVASLEGQSSAGALSGIEVPVKITGSWDRPKYQPDIGSVLNNPQTVETIKEIGKRFRGKNAGEILDGLFGKKGEGESGQSDSGSSAKDLLNNLFKKQSSE